MARVIFTICLSLNFLIVSSPISNSNQEQRIQQLEKRIDVLEKEISRLKKQEERASKYLKCIRKVEGNAITVPFRILNCIRK